MGCRRTCCTTESGLSGAPNEYTYLIPSSDNPISFQPPLGDLCLMRSRLLCVWVFVVVEALLRDYHTL